MPSTRYTVRLPPALDAAVQEHIRAAGTPFAVLIRDALSAYLNQATQHWHTDSTRTHAISVCPGHRVYESRVERFRAS